MKEENNNDISSNEFLQEQGKRTMGAPQKTPLRYSPNPFLILEVMEKLMEYSDYKALKVLRQVSRYWYDRTTPRIRKRSQLNLNILSDRCREEESFMNRIPCMNFPASKLLLTLNRNNNKQSEPGNGPLPGVTRFLKYHGDWITEIEISIERKLLEVPGSVFWEFLVNKVGKYCPNLVELSLQNTHLLRLHWTDDSREYQFKVLSKLKGFKFQHHESYYTRNPNRFMGFLQNQIEKCKGLERIETDFNFSSHMFSTFYSMLTRFEILPNIAELRLENCKLTSRDLQVLCQVREYPRIKLLRIHSLADDSAGNEELVRFLRKISGTLETLDVGGSERVGSPELRSNNEPLQLPLLPRLKTLRNASVHQFRFGAIEFLRNRLELETLEYSDAGAETESRCVYWKELYPLSSQSASSQNDKLRKLLIRSEFELKTLQGVDSLAPVKRILIGFPNLKSFSNPIPVSWDTGSSLFFRRSWEGRDVL